MDVRGAAFAGAVFGLILFAILIGPLLAIWSLNTLFGLSIAYSLKNMLAAFVLLALFGRSSITVKKG